MIELNGSSAIRDGFFHSVQRNQSTTDIAVRYCIFFIEFNSLFETSNCLFHLVLHHEDGSFVSVEFVVVWIDLDGFVIVMKSLVKLFTSPVNMRHVEVNIGVHRLKFSCFFEETQRFLNVFEGVVDHAQVYVCLHKLLIHLNNLLIALDGLIDIFQLSIGHSLVVPGHNVAVVDPKCLFEAFKSNIILFEGYMGIAHAAICHGMVRIQLNDLPVALDCSFHLPNGVEVVAQCIIVGHIFRIFFNLLP